MSGTRKQGALRVFVSSTREDLVAERAILADAVEQLGHYVVRMEAFGARSGGAVEESLAEVERVDVVLAIVGSHYGHVPSAEQGGDGRKSVTWLEIEHALSRSVPVFAYLRVPAAPSTSADERLADYCTFLRDRLVVDEFSDANELARKVVTALSRRIAASNAAARAGDVGMLVYNKDTCILTQVNQAPPRRDRRRKR